MMNNVIVIESEDSENSIIEIEKPKKPIPPLICIDEDEEIILNISGENSEKDTMLAKNFIEKDKESSSTSAVGYSNSLNSPDHWTSDMIKFYNDDWGDEDNFTVEKLQKKMNKDPSLWEVSTKDISRENLDSNIKCWNCGERGHHYALCPNPPHVTKCHMCGVPGHGAHVCPNSICLNCGNHSRKYVNSCFQCRNQMNEMCSRCHLIGHNSINCTDHWRLFHLTTGTTSVKVPHKSLEKTNRDLWCCNCGKKGHNQVWCNRNKNFGGFLNTFPFVISYQESMYYSYSVNNSHDALQKKSKENFRKIDKSEKVLKLNPFNKVIGKHKKDMKNNSKRYQKNKFKERKNFKKNQMKKRVQDRFFADLM